MERVDLEQWKGREVARLLALVETERRYYQEIVASLPIGLIVVSSELSMVSSNRAVRNIFGLLGSDRVRGRLNTILPEWVQHKAREVLETGVPQNGLMVDHDGKRLRISILPARNWGEEAQPEVLLCIEDLTMVPVPPTEPRPEIPAESEGAKETVQAVEPETITEPQPETAQPAAAEESIELLQNLDAIIWALELPSMRFVFVTNTAQDVLGFAPDDWLNTADFFATRILAADREAVLSGYRQAIESGGRCTCEFRSQTAQGGVIWLRETARVLHDSSGRPKHLIGLSTDITERRRLEDERVQAQRMDAIGKLASRLSHDLNNLLMIIAGYGEELQNAGNIPDAVQSDVREILTATDRIAAVTNHLLELTRRQAGAPVAVDVSELIETMRAEDVRVEAEPGIQAKAHEPQLRDLIAALLVWTRQALPLGAALKISAAEAAIHEDLQGIDSPLKPGQYTVITIHAAGAVETLHAPLTPVLEAIVPAKGGAAENALAISQGYTHVRQWGGDIACSDAPSGLQVSIYLTSAGRRVVAPPERQPEPAPAPTILVVEDEPGIRALVRKILKRQGYTILEAPNGEEALKVCQEHSGRIDLLITDVMMPHMDGRALAGALQQQCRDMKVLYVSGYTDDPSMYAGEFPPGTAFLQKPFTLGSLLEKVKQVLAA